MNEIPIKAAKEISEKYGYKQVIIFAVNPGENHYWKTTYGASKSLCKATMMISEEMVDGFCKGCEKLHEFGNRKNFDAYRNTKCSQNCPY